MASEQALRVEERDGRWWLVGETATRWMVVNEFLGYLADRRYSPRTGRAYAFDFAGAVSLAVRRGHGH